jgi:hypothetical protein
VAVRPMKIAPGREVYQTDVLPIMARGCQYAKEDLSRCSKKLFAILRDTAGRTALSHLLTGLTATKFEEKSLRKVLSVHSTLTEWRVGEALAELYLLDLRRCEFPWPSGRDLKNPDASPAGADLVGFQQVNGDYRFAFGEVKTSSEQKWPPGVMTGRHGLTMQLEGLRDLSEIKNALALYLGHRAKGAAWFSLYQFAMRRYVKDQSDVSLFGFLVRDVEPRADDLASRARVLCKDCPTKTSIELRALYLPKGALSGIAARAARNRPSRGGER